MRVSTSIVSLAIVPALALAQGAADPSQGGRRVSASANAAASAQLTRQPATTQANDQARREMSAESQAQLAATFETARQQRVPQQPIQDRVAEGQAKGASDAQIVLAARRAEARLEATQSAMIRAGRANPSDSEVTRGAQAMERGTMSAQLEALVHHTPSDRSLVVAFDVLSSLEARGMPVDHALAVITAKLDARASDASLAQLTLGSDTQGSLGLGRSPSANAASQGNGSAAANAARPQGAAVAGALTAAVSAVIKR